MERHRLRGGGGIKPLCLLRHYSGQVPYFLTVTPLLTDTKISRVNEVRLYYIYPGERSYVVVDCETATHVWEGRLDKRSSLDSVQQALFFSVISGKKPGVVIYDTDGQVGQIEYRIRTACQKVGVSFRLVW